MADYKKMYTKLFGTVTAAIRLLQEVQIETEEMYIDHEPTNLTLLRPEDDVSDDDGGSDA